MYIFLFLSLSLSLSASVSLSLSLSLSISLTLCGPWHIEHVLHESLVSFCASTAKVDLRSSLWLQLPPRQKVQVATRSFQKPLIKEEPSHIEGMYTLSHIIGSPRVFYLEIRLKSDRAACCCLSPLAVVWHLCRLAWESSPESPSRMSDG